ncbi:MAG: DUF2207 domain-containing protein [Gemmatimonadales bacterium]|jgi:hypothetical protein
MSFNSRSSWRPVLRAAACSALASLTLGLTPPGEARAQSRRLTIERFDAEYVVARDGGVEVEERITFRFEGSWNGVYRFIPVKYRLDDGRRHRIDLDVESVTDGQGNSLRHEINREGALVNIKTWVPGARDATRTVVYRYRVGNALRHYDDKDGMDWAHDELYWNVTGDEWDVPINRVNAVVHLPAEVTGVRALAYTGPRGARGSDYDQNVAGSTVSFATTRALSPREGLTLVVGWDPGVIEPPSLMARLGWLIRDYLFLPIPFIAFFVMFRLWWRKGRDPEVARSIMVQYDPPDDLSAAEVGTLMDFTVDPRDLSATIIDLAIRGYLRIEEVPSRWRKKPKDHIIHVLQDPTDVSELKDFEHETLRALWTLAGDEDLGVTHRAVKVSALKQKFYKHVSKIKRLIYGRLTRPPKLFTARPEKVQGTWVGTGIVVGALAVGLGILATNNDLGLPLVRWGSLIATPLIVIGFGLFMPARTLKGVAALNHALGLREYIDRVDRDRLKYVTLEHFEKLLPFAAAMGLEEKWTDAFETIIVEPPGWYVSAQPTHFHAHYFSRSLGSMTSATGAALVSAPRSASSGSGFSGGGGSGGGFGGGGGGGF